MSNSNQWNLEDDNENEALDLSTSSAVENEVKEQMTFFLPIDFLFISLSLSLTHSFSFIRLFSIKRMLKSFKL